MLQSSYLHHSTETSSTQKNSHRRAPLNSAPTFTQVYKTRVPAASQLSLLGKRAPTITWNVLHFQIVMVYIHTVSCSRRGPSARSTSPLLLQSHSNDTAPKALFGPASCAPAPPTAELPSPSPGEGQVAPQGKLQAIPGLWGSVLHVPGLVLVRELPSHPPPAHH